MTTPFEIRPTDALLRIDLINAFGPKGGLPMAEGEDYVDGVNELSQRFYDAGALIVDVQDWHPRDHESFASTHGVPPYTVIQASYGDQMAWPDHAIQNTWDSEFFAGLSTWLAHLVIRKGFNRKIDSYSAFRENDKTTLTGLGAYLRARGITRIVIVGNAYDFCDGYTALDGVEEGFEAIIVRPLTRAIAVPTYDGRTTVDDIEEKFAEAGVTVVETIY